VQRIGVDCRFHEDGSVQVVQIALDQAWFTVEQGRQWVDKLGRYVLIMFADGTVKEICLRSDTMTWYILDVESRGTRLV
jgi:hypothetical protein